MKKLLNYISSIPLLRDDNTLTIRTNADVLRASLRILFVAFFFSPPPIERLTTEFALNDRFLALSQQINGTYNSADYSIESHESKLTFRIVPGLIGKLSFSHDPKSQMLFLYAIQVILGYITIIILVKGIWELTANWLYAKLITSGFMMTHLGSSFFYDAAFFLDGYAFCLMTLSMFTRSGLLSAAFLFIAFWCDERAILGGLGIVLFRNYLDLGRITFRNFLLARYTMLFSTSICIYMFVRLWFAYKYNLTVPLGSSAGVGIAPIWEQRNNLAIAELFTFEFSWIYLLPALALFYKTNKSILVALIIYIAASLVLTGIIYDVMRSVTYLFPVIILGIIIYHHEEPKEEVDRVALVSTLMNMIIPNYRYFYHFYIVLPLPLRLLELFS